MKKGKVLSCPEGVWPAKERGYLEQTKTGAAVVNRKV